jgi:hypothetical protein
MTETAKDKTNKKEKKGRDPVVYALCRPSRCFNCDTRLAVNDIVKLQNKEDDREVLCKQCAGLSGFVFIQKGNPAQTREATKNSKSRFVVMKWSGLWKCYEREGILVEETTE